MALPWARVRAGVGARVRRWGWWRVVFSQFLDYQPGLVLVLQV
jgi:hypothetical protein